MLYRSGFSPRIARGGRLDVARDRGDRVSVARDGDVVHADALGGHELGGDHAVRTGKNNRDERHTVRVHEAATESGDGVGPRANSGSGG